MILNQSTKRNEHVAFRGFQPGGKDVQVVVDQTLSARLGQCSAKIREHIAKIKEYRQWVAVLETQRGDEHIGFDIMGGANQPLAHAQFVSNIVDYGMNLQEALEAPRFTKKTAAGCDVSIEDRVPLSTLQQLSERGHEIRIRRPYTMEMGRGQAILHNSRTRTNYGASDPRADGIASPEPIPAK